MKRLDDFFASEDIKPAVRYPSPTETDESITVVSISVSYFFLFILFSIV